MPSPGVAGGQPCSPGFWDVTRRMLNLLSSGRGSAVLDIAPGPVTSSELPSAWGQTAIFSPLTCQKNVSFAQQIAKERDLRNHYCAMPE
jgi:hypothetical protein